MNTPTPWKTNKQNSTVWNPVFKQHLNNKSALNKRDTLLERYNDYIMNNFGFDKACSKGLKKINLKTSLPVKKMKSFQKKCYDFSDKNVFFTANSKSIVETEATLDGKLRQFFIIIEKNHKYYEESYWVSNKLHVTLDTFKECDFYFDVINKVLYKKDKDTLIQNIAYNYIFAIDTMIISYNKDIINNVNIFNDNKSLIKAQ